MRRVLLTCGPSLSPCAHLPVHFFVSQPSLLALLACGQAQETASVQEGKLIADEPSLPTSLPALASIGWARAGSWVKKLENDCHPHYPHRHWVISVYIGSNTDLPKKSWRKNFSLPLITPAHNFVYFLKLYCKLPCFLKIDWCAIQIPSNPCEITVQDAVI